MEDKNLLVEIINAALEKKADNLVVLKIKEKSSIADYFVICSGNTSTQTKAIADEIEEKVEEKQNLRILRREGFSQGRWVLLDYGHIVVHVFMPEERELYNLERFWGDAPKVDLASIGIVGE